MDTNPLKDVPVLTALLLFGTNHSNPRSSQRLAELYREILFKMRAVMTALDLLLEQEKVLQKMHNDKSPPQKTYYPEIIQMAYIGFFFDAVYSLTEKCANVNKIFYGGVIPNGFNRQRNRFIQNKNIDEEMTRLLYSLDWYDLFREVRVQHTHDGSSFLAFGYDAEPLKGSSQMIIGVSGDKDKKVLKGAVYNFDVRKVAEIKDGVWGFVDDWALTLLNRLNKDLSISWNAEIPKVTLGDFLQDRKVAYK